MNYFRTILAKLTSAVEAGDGRAVAALFTADGVYHDNMYGDAIGRAAIVDMIEMKFHGNARDFLWDMYEAVCDGRIGYARYVVSCTSTRPESAGDRVVFTGFARLRLTRDLLIEDYDEAYDTGAALVQVKTPDDVLRRVLERRAKRMRALAGASHGVETD